MNGWFYFQRLSADVGGYRRAAWTAWVTPNDAYRLAYYSSRPDASTTFWYWNEQEARWVLQRTYTPADEPPALSRSEQDLEGPPERPPSSPRCLAPEAALAVAALEAIAVVAAAILSRHSSTRRT